MPAQAQLSMTDMMVDDANIRAINMARLDASLRAKVVQMLRELERELIANISDVVENDPVTAARLKTLLAQVRKTIGTHYANIYDLNKEDLGKVAQAHAYQIASTVNGLVGVELMSLQTDAQQLQNLVTKTPIMGRYLEEWWQKQGTELFSRFTQQMRLGMLQGEGVNELVQRVRGTRAMGYTDAMMRMPTYQAEALVRTATVSIANTGRLQAYQDNADVLEGIQWLATLDDRICEICMALDGCMWALPDGADPNKYGDYESLSGDKDFPGPTAHVNCRCVQVPVVKSYKDLVDQGAVAGDEKDDVDKEMRASMDGQVSETDGFEGWLKSKDEAFQDELLGADKAAAWRAGDISIKDLTDQSNRPVTADQLLAEVTPKARPPSGLSDAVSSKKVLGGGVQDSWILEFQNGEHGVFKPESGESISMRDNGPTCAVREVASSDIAQMVGMDDLVPEAIMREVDGQLGSIEAFVPNSSEGGAVSMSDSPKGQIARSAAWDYFVGNTDRHGGNWMVDKDNGNIQLIDNGLTFPGNGNDRSFRSNLFDEARHDNILIPPDVVHWMEKWDDIEAYMSKNGFTSSQIESAHWRLQQLGAKERFGDLPHALDYLYQLK